MSEPVSVQVAADLAWMVSLSLGGLVLGGQGRRGGEDREDEQGDRDDGRDPRCTRDGG